MLALARSIKEAYEKDELVDAVIWGSKGYGKSVYSLLILYEVYGSWPEALKHLWFNPEPLRKRILYNLENDIRVPLEVIDDASMHLSKRSWNEWKIKRFGNAYNAIREVCGGFLFTSPNKEDIAKDIREEVQGNIPIYKEIGTKRTAIVYHWKSNVMKTYPTREKQDYFDLKAMPEYWYWQVYKPMKKAALREVLTADEDGSGNEEEKVVSRLQNLSIVKKNGETEGRPLVCPKCNHHWLHRGTEVRARCPKCFQRFDYLEINEPAVIIV